MCFITGFSGVYVIPFSPPHPKMELYWNRADVCGLLPQVIMCEQGLGLLSNVTCISCQSTEITSLGSVVISQPKINPVESGQRLILPSILHSQWPTKCLGALKQGLRATTLPPLV